MSKCSANSNDIIMLKAGHAENVVDATTQVCDKAGVSIIGLGNGTNAPTFTYTATAGSFELDAANTYLHNVRLLASVSAVVVGMNVDAANVTVDNCVWNYDATGDDFLIGVDVDTVNHAAIQNCRMYAQAGTAGAAQGIRLDIAHWATVIGNTIMGDYSAACIMGEGAASLNIDISNNKTYNDDTASTNQGIDLSVACTGIVSYNVLTGLQGTNVVAQLDPGSCLNIENYACNAIDEKGILIGGTASS